jgi:thiamine biosynthesis protein ThiS
MKITINGKEQIYDPTTLAVLIEQLGMKQDRVAVELNRNIVPRTDWAATNLAEGDRLEIVHFVGGGNFVAPASRRLS